jgi:hypothetical protein
MVEVFDARGVPFVAITQQFNTTQSVGHKFLVGCRDGALQRGVGEIALVYLDELGVAVHRQGHRLGELARERGAFLISGV